MSLDTYSGLKADIASYLARSDVTTASESLNTFIDLAEAYINKRLRVMRMHKNTNISSTAEMVELPDDFLEVFTFSHVSLPKDMTYVPAQAFKMMAAGEHPGRPSAFTVGWNNGAHVVRFLPSPDSTYDFPLTYFAKIPALSDENTVNWLLTDYPELYLNASLYYAFRRYRSPLAGEYKSLADSDIAELNDEYQRVQTGGGGTRMRVAGTVV